MKKHFITFYSPGTIVAESTTKPINKWNIEQAMKMAREIKERYDATPYGFRFSTRERSENDFDSHEVKKSNMYFLGGKIETLSEVKARNDPKEEILVINMQNYNCKRVITNTNSWKWTQILNDDDIVLDFVP